MSTSSPQPKETPKSNPEYPFPTEEPIRRPWLKEELDDINTVDDESSSSKTSPTSSEEGIVLQNVLPSHQDFSQARQRSDSDSTDESDWDEEDEELLKRTESNRVIPPEEGEETTGPTADLKRIVSVRQRLLSEQRHLLVFTDPEIVVEPSRATFTLYYGVRPAGSGTNSRKPRSYFVACDFSEESFYAIEWTIGTMMRDGDRLYVTTVVNREDNPDAAQIDGMTPSGELESAAGIVTEKVKGYMAKMLLFDIKVSVFAVSGRVKDVLKQMIRELTLTMVVCGSRGRSTMKGLLMGSISTYLVHKSPVPVTVIRPQKFKQKQKKHHVAAASLSESVKTGHLHVDELAN
ncbi:hypothetical protein J3Q64DRAFT_1812994 [Phycomyces blakesleeanus]|uniref:UspA domain-containing protein n=1 Tax=Phycomyces blakesleeanus TaxID=4837 RepID=A0ABR3BB93_PHYBL